MKTISFRIELKKNIANSRLLVLRNLYQPIIGIEASSLYQLLIDYEKINKNSQGTYQILADIINIHKNEIVNKLNILQAAGLMRIWENHDGIVNIIQLIPPQSATEFRNSILYKSNKSKLNETLHSQIQFYNEHNEKIDKLAFQEVTTKYHDVFEIKEEQVTTMNMHLKQDPQSVEEAIIGLPSISFVKYVTKKRVSPSQNQLIINLNAMGMTSECINLLIDYSIRVNKKIVIAYVQKIANDFGRRGILNSFDIRLELDHAFKSKTGFIETSMATPIIEELENDNDEFTNSNWKSIVDEMGDL